jgi:hypothetical protein
MHRNAPEFNGSSIFHRLINIKNAMLVVHSTIYPVRAHCTARSALQQHFWFQPKRNKVSNCIVAYFCSFKVSNDNNIMNRLVRLLLTRNALTYNKTFSTWYRRINIIILLVISRISSSSSSSSSTYRKQLIIMWWLPPPDLLLVDIGHSSIMSTAGDDLHQSRRHDKAVTVEVTYIISLIPHTHACMHTLDTQNKL